MQVSDKQSPCGATGRAFPALPRMDQASSIGEEQGNGLPAPDVVAVIMHEIGVVADAAGLIIAIDP